MKISKESLISLCGAIAGSLFILLVILGINGLEGLKKNDKSTKTVSFGVKQQKKKKSQKPTAAIRKPKTKPKPKAPAPLLSSNLTGASFGLEQFEFLGEMGDGLLGDSSNAIMTEDTVDQLPIVRFRDALEYPSYARKKNIEGHVILNLLIGNTGSVEEIKLISSMPEGVFNEVAMASAKNWQFDPAQYQGKNVKIWVRQKVTFNLN